MSGEGAIGMDMDEAGLGLLCEINWMWLYTFWVWTRRFEFCDVTL